MRSKLTKTVFLAGIVLVLASIFSCSETGGNSFNYGFPSSSSNDGTGGLPSLPSSGSNGIDPGRSSSSVATGGGSSSSAGTSQGGVGSCIHSEYPVCGENVSQAECLEGDGTFSNSACNATTYNYCIKADSYPPSCDLIGSTAMPNKASCPADEDGTKVFASESFCGPKGSCILSYNMSFMGGPNLQYCLDMNKGICENIYGDAFGAIGGATFRTGECSIAAYTCCVVEGEGGNVVIPITSSFTKSTCYSMEGLLASASTCAFLQDDDD